MRLAGLKDRLSGCRLVGETALHGDSPHLSKLNRVFDPLVVSPELQISRSLIILAFSNRSGSTHLGQLLSSAPDLYGFREDLNHNIVARRVSEHRLADLASYLQHVTSLQAKPGAGFGLKASGEQLRLIRMARMDQAFDQTNVIRIRRRDQIAQAVSLWIAWRTRQWTSRQEQRAVTLSYSYRELRKCLKSVQSAEGAIDLALDVLPYKSISVEYEDLCKDPVAAVNSLRQNLGLPASETCPRSRIEQQSSAQKTEYVERFRSDLAKDWSMDVL